MSVLTFGRFLRDAAAEGELIDTLFPPIEPVSKRIPGSEVMVIPVGDLVWFRSKDQVHIKALDAAGLITPKIESGLPAGLSDRLRHVCETE